jgi:thiamine biosynthesis lipoprotein
VNRGRRAHARLVVIALAAAACGPPPPEPPHLAERAAVSMGSELRLSAWTTDERATIAAFTQVFAEFERLDSLFSVWRSGSDVQRLNAAAGDRPVAVSADTREVLRAARRVSDWTGGKFDITFGGLADIWKFDHDQDNRVPTAHEIRARLPLVDFTAVQVDETAATAFIARKGVRIHLGGIGKGYAVDRGAAILRAAGVHDFLIQAGGDLYASGRRGDRAWRAAIADPRATGTSFAAMDLTSETFSTSGDYERFFIKDGRRYHHILDPDLGEPARGSRSVTIVTSSALDADGLSTGIFILGPEAGMALIERLDGVEGVIVTDRNEVLVSSGLKSRLALVRMPTEAP